MNEHAELIVNEHAELIGEIESYCRHHGVAELTFGKLVVNDGKFVGRLREGRRVTTATVSRVRRYLDERAAAAPPHPPRRRRARRRAQAARRPAPPPARTARPPSASTTTARNT